VRDALLSAALNRFAADGVAATPLDAVRRDAGASVGSLYHAFPGGKADLTAALYVETLAGYQDAFLGELRRAADARSGIECTVQLHLRWHVRHRAAARFLHSAREPELRATMDTPLRERNADFFGAIRAWLSPHVDAGVVRELPTAVLHALWLGPAQELCRHWLAGAVRTPGPATRALLADAAWRALRAEPTKGGTR
jgi:AcrR family transcriptional regulator